MFEVVEEQVVSELPESVRAGSLPYRPSCPESIRDRSMQVRRREVELREVAIIAERDTGGRRWRPREGRERARPGGRQQSVNGCSYWNTWRIVVENMRE